MSDGTTTPGSDGVAAAATALADAVSDSLTEFIDEIVANVNSDTIANAQASAAAAAQSATAAAASASQASQASTTSATNSGSAAQNATWASQAATAAAAAAAEAMASQTSTSTSYQATLAALNAFNATATALTGFMHTYNQYFLGAGPNDPTQDGNGNPVSAGAMYENTTDNIIRVYSGTAWNNIDYTIADQLAAAQAAATAAAASATAAATSETAAAAAAALSQSWASQANGVVNGTSSLSALQYAAAAAASGAAAAGSANNASASATEAAASATQAQTNAGTATAQATNAAGSAVAASGSATTATTQAGNAAAAASAASGSASSASGSATAASTSAGNASASATAAAASAAAIGAFGLLSGIVAVGGNTNLNSASYGKMYEVPAASAGGYTIAAPSFAGADDGKCFGICNLSSGSITLTAANIISAYGKGVSSVTIPANTVTIFQMDGANLIGIAGSGAIGASLVPVNAAGPGQWQALTPTGSGASSTFELPGTPTQLYAYFVVNNGIAAAGVAAGESGVLGPFTVNNAFGFCWRVG